MNKLLNLTTIVAILLIFGCQKTEIEEPATTAEPFKGQLKSEMVVPFIAAQNINIGNATVSDDASGINVDIDISGSGWEFDENHIYVGTEPPAHPAPGQFPYSGTQVEPDRVLLSVPFTELGAFTGDFYIAVHAEVSQGQGGNESAWAIPDGLGIPWLNNGGKQIGWGVYFTYNVTPLGDIYINPADADISSINCNSFHRNLRLNGNGDEVRIFRYGEPFLPPTTTDFDLLPPYGSYYLHPGVNHVSFAYIPDVDFLGLFGLLSCQTQVNGGIYVTAIPTVVNLDFDVIQFKLYTENGSYFILRNVSVNGIPDESGNPLYRARSNSPMWNITGDLLNPIGICFFEADIDIYEPASGEEDLYLEVRFGKL
jgi:hypothetical protein